jgi:broad specificity phosphatase PhoE
MNTFYPVRHAHAAWTPDEDRPLSAQGQSDAIRVADLLEKQRIDTLYSSPCRRAHQTIEPLAARLCSPFYTELRLEELNLGQRSQATIARLWPGL